MPTTCMSGKADAPHRHPIAPPATRTHFNPHKRMTNGTPSEVDRPVLRTVAQREGRPPYSKPSIGVPLAPNGEYWATAGIRVLVVFLMTASILRAQTPPAATTLSDHEPGLMLLTVSGIVILSGVVFRLLILIKLIRRMVWLLPILIVFAAAALVTIRITDLYTYRNLYALACFLFIFLIFVSSLYPVARLVMPSNAMRTRAGVPPLLRGLAVGTVTFVGMFALLTWFFPGLSLTPMFVTSGVVSIVVGLAIQDPLSNLIAGVLMTVERPFRMGDWIQIGNLQGEVVDITWRATRIRTRENDVVLIPNSVTAKESLINYDQPSPVHMLKIKVGIAYDTPCALVTAALVEAATKVESVLTNPPPSAHLRDFADSAQVYELRVWIDNAESGPAIESDVRKQVWYTLKKRAITIPFPQRDMHVRRVTPEPGITKARLVAITGPLKGSTHEIEPEGLLVGRAPECGLIVPDPRVSHNHAQLILEKGQVTLRDLDSTHGTKLNGKPITATVLRPGDEIELGETILVFESNSAPERA